MKTLLLAATAVAFAAAANLSSASAAGPKASGNAWPGVPPTLGSELPGSATGGRHYEWQYGYVGHHPRFQGHWVLVR